MFRLNKIICYGHINCDRVSHTLCCAVCLLFCGLFYKREYENSDTQRDKREYLYEGESVAQTCVGMSCVSYLSDVLYSNA